MDKSQMKLNMEKEKIEQLGVRIGEKRKVVIDLTKDSVDEEGTACTKMQRVGFTEDNAYEKWRRNSVARRAAEDSVEAVTGSKNPPARKSQPVCKSPPARKSQPVSKSPPARKNPPARKSQPWTEEELRELGDLEFAAHSEWMALDADAQNDVKEK